MTPFGTYVRERRKELNLNGSELAKVTGLSEGAISRIERGERTDLKAETAYRLAKALQVTADDLLERLSEPVPA